MTAVPAPKVYLHCVVSFEQDANTTLEAVQSRASEILGASVESLQLHATSTSLPDMTPISSEVEFDRFVAMSERLQAKKLDLFCLPRGYDLNEISKLALRLETDIGRKLQILKTNYPLVHERVENDFEAQFGTEKDHFPDRIEVSFVEKQISELFDYKEEYSYVPDSVQMIREQRSIDDCNFYYTYKANKVGDTGLTYYGLY